jgi:hypothetical protein
MSDVVGDDSFHPINKFDDSGAQPIFCFFARVVCDECWRTEQCMLIFKQLNFKFDDSDTHNPLRQPLTHRSHPN